MAIAKQFAEILHFTLSFDDLKMTNPAIQNDFSYYRRTLNRRKMNLSLTLENTTDCFSTMASVCRVINSNPEYSSRFECEDSAVFCLRVVVDVIILYDHVHPVGAFAKKAAIDMKSSIRLIKENPQCAESLLNSLRYNTKHFNDEVTPKTTKTMLST